MATQALEVTSILKTDANLNGIFGLNNTSAQTVSFDDTNHVLMANAASAEWGRVLPGEWAFFPVAPGVGLELKASVALNIEYAFFRQP